MSSFFFLKVFLSSGFINTLLAYMKSANCCVEFWEAVQTPRKLRICIVEELSREVMIYLETLVEKGARVVSGYDQCVFFCFYLIICRLIELLNMELENTSDGSAYNWWKGQNIIAGTVPESVAPSSKWEMIPYFGVIGSIFMPVKSLACGPVYISGNCRKTGFAMKLPWLFIVSVFAILSNGYDIYLKATESAELHTYRDFIWLGIIAICNMSPFFAFSNLLDTRIFCDVCLPIFNLSYERLL